MMPHTYIKSEPTQEPTPDLSLSSQEISSSGTLTPKVKDENEQQRTEPRVAERSERKQRFTAEDIDPSKLIALDDDDEEEVNTKFDRIQRSAAPSVMSSAIPVRQASAAPSAYASNLKSKFPGASFKLIGRFVNLLVDAIETLRGLGLHELATELPELILVGDQSAGKSSLMSAIAEINLPKSEGICTRCPLNIKTSTATTWSCTVSLHLYYDYHRTTRRIPRPTNENRFPPWDNAGRLTIHKFKTISEKSELENVLRWAQIALLNPSQDFRAFIPGTGVVANSGVDYVNNEADFSPNIVMIEISGPNLPALSFYDLPGIFHKARNADEAYLVDVFENIAAEYIQHKNALVICTMAMQNDPSNGKTLAIVEKYNAEKRTIGVMTMPDRLQGDNVDWDAVWRGQAHPLDRGYFATKQPGPDFVSRDGVDFHTQAREEETGYFDTDSRWTGLWRPYRHRCGTGAIQEYLSQEFARLIAESMPNIERQIKVQAEKVDRDLRSLPELPRDNLQHIVRSCLYAFSNRVHGIFEQGLSSEFLSDWGKLTLQFDKCLKNMKPKFVIVDPSDHNRITRGHEVYVIDSDGESVPSTPAPTPRKRNAPQANATPSKQAKQSNHPSPFPNVISTPVRGQSVRVKQERAQSGDVVYFERFVNSGSGFSSIGKVRELIAKHRTPGFPNEVPTRAKEELWLRSLQNWLDPVRELAQETHQLLKRHTLHVLTQALGDYKQTLLFRESYSHLVDYLEKHRKEQLGALEKLFYIESYRFFTLDKYSLDNYEAQEHQELKAKRRVHRAGLYVTAKGIDKELEPEKYKKQIASTKDEDLGVDPFAKEISTAAHVRGYYRIAAARFSDQACKNIQFNLFREIQTQINGLLENLLGINEGVGEDKCRELLVEKEDESRKRAAWQEKKLKLAEAAEHFAKLVRDLGVSPDPEDAGDRMAIDEDFHEEPHAAVGRGRGRGSPGLFVPQHHDM